MSNALSAIDSADSDELIIARTRAWIERAVIGLNLCPFAKPAYSSGRIRYHVSPVKSHAALLEALRSELTTLHAADAQAVETTLLIHPRMLVDFYEYNDFLDDAEALVAKLGLEAEFQIASFHPRYQFADCGADDIDNYTNRSPYPMLHLLRESSIERAIAAMANPAEIYERNIETMRRLGHEGWRRLWLAALK